MESSLFRLSAEEIDLCETVNALCESIEGEDETNWDEGECLECTLGDFLVGAFWAFTECHGGQASPTYETLCRIGNIYSPGMASGPEGYGEKAAYEQVTENLLKR